jgi:parvulin-like peptidyl-prolyl isomerase
MLRSRLRKSKTDTTHILTRALPPFAILLTALLVSSSSAFGETAEIPSNDLSRVVARVNGVAITEAAMQDEIEVLYPSNSAHGGIRPEKLQELRAKARDELIVEELAYQQAVKNRALVPMTQVRTEYEKIRKKYSAPAFDSSLQARGLTRQQYLKALQRRMTLQQLIEKQVVLPSRQSPAALRDYYEHNLKKFERPERVHTRLILAALDPNAGAAAERKARDKIDKVYRGLQAGKDFAALAEQYSDDFYRVKGGDVGWMHRGSMDPEFEKLAFTLPVGQFSAPFRTPYGFNILKVEAREPAKLMTFEEVQAKLKAELEKKRFEELRQAWIEQLKKGARIELVKVEAAAGLRAAH